jgi:hypothetical protein
MFQPRIGRSLAADIIQIRREYRVETTGARIVTLAQYYILRQVSL